MKNMLSLLLTIYLMEAKNILMKAESLYFSTEKILYIQDLI